jgi:predicted acetylornithine/succinylornithine family transaminase
MSTNQEIIERSSQVLMNTYGRFPVALVRGEGCFVWDADGKKYLDLVGGIAVNILGHGHPRLVKALTDQASRLIHVSNLYHMLPQVELAEALTRLSFADRVFFCNSGAEANEGAVKLARKYFKKAESPEKYKVVCMENSFHGRTLAMISATGQAKVKKGFEPLVEGFSHVPFGNEEALEKAIDPSTAAVLLEPVQGEGGIHLASPDYLRSVRDLCDRKKILLIYDEVQSGMGRTGKLFAYEHSGVTPHMMTLAKGLAGGVPIGAILATEGVAQAFSPGDHAATFGGNPLVTRAALEVLAVLEEGVLENCRKVGAYFFEGLRRLALKHPVIAEIRGLGLMIGLELSRPGKEIVDRGLGKGLLLNCTQENVLRFVPPLILSREEVDLALKILDELLGGL